MNNYYRFPVNYQYNDRLAPGFITPFILGGITGGLISPLFYNNGYNRPRPYYYYNNYYYPQYGGYYYYR